jgi:ATP-binding cassette subfamily B protein
VAHRLSTIQKADQIVLLEKGRIEEKGTHAELMSLNGQYRKMYNLQFDESIS